MGWVQDMRALALRTGIPVAAILILFIWGPEEIGADEAIVRLSILLLSLAAFLILYVSYFIAAPAQMDMEQQKKISDLEKKSNDKFEKEKISAGLERIHAFGGALLNEVIDPREDDFYDWIGKVREWNEQAEAVINQICPAQTARKFRMEAIQYDTEFHLMGQGNNFKLTEEGLKNKLQVLKEMIRENE